MGKQPFHAISNSDYKGDLINDNELTDISGDNPAIPTFNSSHDYCPDFEVLLGNFTRLTKRMAQINDNLVSLVTERVVYRGDVQQKWNVLLILFSDCLFIDENMFKRVSRDADWQNVSSEEMSTSKLSPEFKCKMKVCRFFYSAIVIFLLGRVIEA